MTSLSISEHISSVSEFLTEISHLIAKHKVTGIAVALVTDRDVHTYQFGLDTEDLGNISELFQEYKSLTMMEH